MSPGHRKEITLWSIVMLGMFIYLAGETWLIDW
jgi:hypothetical protein